MLERRVENSDIYGLVEEEEEKGDREGMARRSMENQEIVEPQKSRGKGNCQQC